ncbi:SMI1/KNR4 family protein [Kineococcus sp. SYSU DK004]|uniref:SMI1/KNR4 family protein n=1 Tax=Kineococcus sp. SYSU DK004 TaxID=3383125 RepID=UPI003D7DCD21
MSGPTPASDPDRPGDPSAAGELVQAPWEQIRAWLQTHAPATLQGLRPPAPEADLAAAQQVTGWAWPGQLLALYRLHDGWQQPASSQLLPGLGALLPVQQLLQQWRTWQEVSADLVREDVAMGGQLGQELAEAEQAPAGTVAEGFISAYLPIADDGGSTTLVLDARPGSWHGCVWDYDKHEGDRRGVLWPSLAVLLEQVGDSLRTGSPVCSWRPGVVDGHLTWQLNSTLDAARPYPPRLPGDDIGDVGVPRN